MKTVFSNHFASDEARREKLWANCIFVFDTNVYTGIYKRSDDARDAFYNIAGNLGARLWAPYQVIYEYLDNRAKISHDQSCLYEEAIAGIVSIVMNLETQTKHPFLSVGLHSEFIAVADKVKDELGGKKEFHRSRINNDDIRDRLLDILDGKVGEKYTKDQLKAIIKEGEVRYANMDAPGFKDSAKHKGSVIFDHVCKRYGDLIMWKQIIDKAKAESKSVILVTEEQKDDWWEKAGGMTIGPLPELIEEFGAETGQDFYLYSYHSFLELANSYLAQKTSIDVINEVKVSSLDIAYMERLGEIYRAGSDDAEQTTEFPHSMTADWETLKDRSDALNYKSNQRGSLERKKRDIEENLNLAIREIHGLNCAIDSYCKDGESDENGVIDQLKRIRIEAKLNLRDMRRKLNKMDFVIAGLIDY